MNRQRFGYDAGPRSHRELAMGERAGTVGARTCICIRARSRNRATGIFVFVARTTTGSRWRRRDRAVRVRSVPDSDGVVIASDRREPRGTRIVRVPAVI